MNTAPRITARTCNGHLHVRVRHGWIDAEGLTAVIIIIIIVAARIARALVLMMTRITVRAIMLIVPVAARLVKIVTIWSARHLAGIVLAFRAFYVP
jgi:hypothetical protein